MGETAAVDLDGVLKVRLALPKVAALGGAVTPVGAEPIRADTMRPIRLLPKGHVLRFSVGYSTLPCYQDPALPGCLLLALARSVLGSDEHDG